MKLKLDRNFFFVLLSLSIQVPLAVFLGHYYDERVFMAAGYLVGSGFNPYLPHNFVGVFPSAVISGFIPSIGYPPPYPLLLGLIYKATFSITQNVLAYNFALKVPIVAANICLAYLVKNIVEKKAAQKKAQTAFMLILFNPFILLTSVAWGEIDTIVAAFCLASIYLLTKSKITSCAILLGLAAAIKPIALPLAALPILYSSPTLTGKNKLVYMMLFSATFIGLYFGPFFVAGWKIPIGPNEWNAHQQMAGGLTMFTVVELFSPTGLLPQALSFLGYLWIPALLSAYVIVYRARPNNLEGLIKMSVVVLIVFFISRTWVSEPNVNLLLTFTLIAASIGAAKVKEFHLAWIIPLVFMLPNYAFPQLFFLVDHSIMQSIQLFNDQYGTARVVMQFAVAFVWQVFAFKLAEKMFRRRAATSELVNQKKQFENAV